MGAGFVGTTTAVTFAELGHKVICIDTDAKKVESLSRGKPPFYEPSLKEMLIKHLEASNIRFSTDAKSAIEASTIIFICVGTPATENGDADLTYVRQAALSIGAQMNGYRLVVNKSTAPVGTCTRIQNWIWESQTNPWEFDVVSNPEFLREGNALFDFLHPRRVIIGSTNAKPAALMQNLYEGLACPIIHTNPNTAELIKYASNSFLATKISFMNELARLCDTLKVNIRDVANGMGLDSRIGSDFLEAGVGYGGSCFPKDVSALLQMAGEYEVNLTILRQVKQVNDTQWVYLLNKILSVMGSVKGKSLAVYGLSFKPNTNDTRESPSRFVILHLAKQGATVRVHDPITTLPSSLQLPAIRQCQTPEAAADEADAVVICTDWPEYRDIDWGAVKTKMRQAYVFDGRNMLDMELMRSFGFSYHGIGYSN